MERSIDSFLVYLGEERNLSENTIRSYRSDLAQFQAFLADHDISSPRKVDHLAIRQFMAVLHRGTDCREGRQRSTVARKVSALRSFFRYLVREGTLKNDPTGLIRTPRRARKLPAFLTEEEVDQLLASVPTDRFIGIRDRALLEVLYSAGIRVGEAVGADMQDLNLRAGFLRVRGKGKRERLALLGAPSLAALEAYIPERKTHIARRKVPATDALFINARSAGSLTSPSVRLTSPSVRLTSPSVRLTSPSVRLTSRSVRRILKGHLIRAGLNPGISPHALRHSFATHLLSRGANLREVQELLGHKRIASTQIYTHVDTEHLRDVYRKTHPRSR